jgi:putative ABC transport system permease protein
VAPGYFEAMGIPMVEGRTLTVRDRSLDPGPVVISQSIKEAYWPRSSALGKRMSVNGYPATVGGVAGDVHNTGLDVPVDRFVYRLGVDPIGPRVRSMTLALRTEADPLGLVGEVRRIVAAIDPDLPVTDIRSMESVVGDSLNRAAFTMAVLALAAVTALILGAVVIYGVLAYAVTRRTGEIGLRQALGADRGSVRRLIIREGLVMGAVGIVAGLAVAVGMGGVLSSSLYGVGPRDVPVLIGASLVLLAVAVLASAIPAFRAARISPAEALRRA